MSVELHRYPTGSDQKELRDAVEQRRPEYRPEVEQQAYTPQERMDNITKRMAEQLMALVEVA